MCPVLLKDAAAERRPTASVATSPTSIHSAGGEAFPGRKEPMRTFTCEWSATVGDEYELVSKLGDDLSCSRAASRSLAQRHARLLVRAPRLCACRHPQPLCVLICVRVCPHQFCKACMTQAVARNPRCPICRRSVEFLRVDVRVTGGVARDRGCIPVGDCARRELERRRGEPGAVIADGDIAASAGGGVGAAEAAAADEEMAAAAAAAYAAEEQEQQDEEEQVSLAEAAASAAARERREVQAVLAAAAASAARREMVEAQERSDRCLASRLRAELRAEGRCWLLALVLAGELHEGISDVDARGRARAAMRRNLTLRVEAHGWVLRSVGDVNEGRRGARRAGRGGSDGGGGGELPPLAALLARSGLGLVVTSLRGADAASRALAEDAVRERLGRQLGAVRG